MATDAAVLEVFAKDVGGLDDGPVTCVGGRTQWDVGGRVASSVREVRAPSGVVEYEPAEMVVRVRAGTSVAELDAAVSAGGQQVALDPAPGSASTATVGGVLAVGRSGLRRLRYGPVRDTVLEVRVVLADGSLVKAGGPVVKNVSGYDLSRLLVGSLGTIGFLAEVVLRCAPRPAVAVWLRRDGADPFAARERLFRPSSILWDGAATWVLLEGGAADVAAERSSLGDGWTEVEGPPLLPAGGRRSVRPSELRTLEGPPGSFVAEVGVGTIHLASVAEASAPHPSTAALQRRIKEAFDPTGRLNPGRSVA
jgi:glycolate oxidase FAD binding subunit